MADDVRITNLPDSGSPARVAYDLYKGLAYAMPEGQPGFSDLVRRHLALYGQCLNATTHRNIDVSKLT